MGGGSRWKSGASNGNNTRRFKLNNYSAFIYKTRYSRYLTEENRREEWHETVKRYQDFFAKQGIPADLLNTVAPMILDKKVMPSMRSLMTAGPALARSNIAGYNCAALTCNYVDCFKETLYVLMNGCGMGFSCEQHEVDKLPVVAESDEDYIPKRFTVQDTKEGWADALGHAIELGYAGRPTWFNLRKIRPKGARLKTFGGRASGPGPLQELLTYVGNLFVRAAGRRLTSLEVHDLVCRIAQIVVVGGVRRSALISLSSLDDQALATAKAGDWWTEYPERALANNSAVYESKPTWEVFKFEWRGLASNGSGERGIVNREALKKQVARWGKRSQDVDYVTNPCAEIILQPSQFCNLTEVIIRPEDSLKDLLNKVEAATILGTMQATLTNFQYINPKWKENAEQEYLLGVSLTGIMDHPTLSKADEDCRVLLQIMKEHAEKVNKDVAVRLGIKPSAAITTVKPSGTVSQLCGTSSGIHVRYADCYLRTVRLDKKDPVYAMLLAQGYYIEDEIYHPDTTAVVYFPQRAPKGAKTRHTVTLKDQLELWLLYKMAWCHHSPSCSIYVGDDEWDECAEWVYDHFDAITGLSFFPKSNHTYRQAPYQELTEEELTAWEAAHPQPVIDWSKLPEFELEDATTSSQEVACVGGQCEL